MVHLLTIVLGRLLFFTANGHFSVIPTETTHDSVQNFSFQVLKLTKKAKLTFKLCNLKKDENIIAKIYQENPHVVQPIEEKWILYCVQVVFHPPENGYLQ